MSSIAEHRRVLELEARVGRLDALIAEMRTALDAAMARCTELEVRLDTPRLSNNTNNNTQRRA